MGERDEGLEADGASAFEETQATAVVDHEGVEDDSELRGSFAERTVAEPSISSDAPTIGESSSETFLSSLRSASGASTARPGSGLLTSTEVTSPEQVMVLQECQRMRLFTEFAAALSIVLAIVIPALDGDELATGLHLGTVILSIVVNLGLRVYLRDPTRYRPSVGIAAGLVAATAVVTGFYFWGVASAVCLVVPIGVYFFALNENRAGALLVYLYGATGHAVLSLLLLGGVISDASLVRPVRAQFVSDLGMFLALQAAFFASFLMARSLRKASFETLEQLDRAVRNIAQREALLDEARHELARVVRVGEPGRFTEHEIGSYTLGVVLGHGAMGDVYDAVHTESGAPAAVKLLNASAMRNKELVERFYRELEIASSMDVDEVVRVLEHADASAPLPYLAMERLSGTTLSVQLREKGRLSRSQFKSLARALTRGIGAAHDKGIVHRDLKPQNVFGHRQEGSTVWKILDFGVSKLNDEEANLTHGRLVGTPSYMAPEQASGAAVDHRADLYSIAVLLYRAMTGRPAFSGKSLAAIVRSLTTTMPPPPSKHLKVPEEVDLVFAIGMAKDPDERFQSADELFHAFDAALDGSITDELRMRGEALVAKMPWSA